MQRRSLNCWKEIAAYLGCGVRTAQRWEGNLGLPVRRPNSSEYRIVVAFEDELDTWRELWSKADVSKAEAFSISLHKLEADILTLQTMVRKRAREGNVRSIVITFDQGSTDDQDSKTLAPVLKSQNDMKSAAATRKAGNSAKQADSLLSNPGLVRRKELTDSTSQQKI